MISSMKKKVKQEKRDKRLKEKNYINQKNTKNIINEKMTEIIPYKNKDQNKDKIIIFEEMRNSSKILEQILRKLEKLFDELYRINWEEENFVDYCRGEKKPKKKSQKINLNFKITSKTGRKLIFHFKKSPEMPKKVSKKSKENFPIILNNLLEKIKKKIRNNEIIFYKQFVTVIENMVNKIFSKYNFLKPSYFFQKYSQIMTEKIKQYKIKKLLDTDFLLTNWKDYKQKITKYPKYSLQPRLFNEIDNYKSVLEKSEKDNKKGIYNLENILKSDLRPDCLKNCCCSKKNVKIEAFCECSILESTWKSKCRDKYNRIECDDFCGCLGDCKNRDLQVKKKKSPKDKIFMQIVWGVDFYTRKNLVFLLPNRFSVSQKDFLVDKVVKNLNFVGIEGWDISKTLEIMIAQIEKKIKKEKRGDNKKEKLKKKTPEPKKKNPKKEELNFEVEKIYNSTNELTDTLKPQKITLQDELISYKTLLTASKIKQLRQALRIHSKGLGVICKNKNGIKKNSLITEYLGEIYPPYYWSLKQNIIRNFLKNVKKNSLKNFSKYKTNYQVDFYNIMVEKQKNESNGREIFFVDPIINGNYASRLSHSCNPNCWAIPVISNGQYCIGMYAIRDIGYREELTFDYCSFTESEKEYKNSICLCGDYLCKAYYLSYTSKHEEFFCESVRRHLIDFEKLVFLRNNVLVLKSGMEVFCEEKERFLREYSFGDNTFKDSPNWVKCWTYFALKNVVKERILLKEFLLKKSKVFDQNQNVISFEIENLYFQRINNLIITIDKIRHFCSKQNNEKAKSPPLKKLTFKAQIEYYEKIISQILEYKDIQKNKKMLNLIKNFQKQKYPENFKKFISQFPSSKKLQILLYKLLFFKLSIFFSQKKTEKTQIISDLLYFHSFTILQFTNEKYKEFSVKFKIRKCDLTNPLKNLERNLKSKKEQLKDLEETIIELPKKLISNYLWGQLVFWSKQNLAEPENLLNLKKKGVLEFPDFFRSFFLKKKKLGFKRKKWIFSILENPEKNWGEDFFGYEGGVLGSFVFDDFFFERNSRKEILGFIDQSEYKKFEYFKRFWKIGFKEL